jgi:N-acyl-phosphatidylethanolamine-hydrolysing phospholipase D
MKVKREGINKTNRIHPMSTKKFKFLKFFARRLQRELPSVPNEHIIPSEQIIQTLEKWKTQNTITWLGHDTFLIRLDGKTILTDPFFSDYASPIKGLGPKRYVAPALSITQLPQIDIITVSHDHYDHLDLATLAALPNKKNIHVVVPRGLGKFFTRLGYTSVHELDWQQQWNHANLNITALPAIHFSGRAMFAHNKTLWTSFNFEIPNLRIYFSGDTGYGPIFKNIGRQYQHFDYAILDIGAYEPRELLSAVHINPEEAVQIGKDIFAKNLIAMHWGTIKLSDEPIFEPPQQFLEAGKAAGYKEEALWVLKIGETKILHSCLNVKKNTHYAHGHL